MMTEPHSSAAYRLMAVALWTSCLLLCAACKPDRPNIVEARKKQAEMLAKQTQATVGNRQAAQRIASGGLDPSTLTPEQAGTVVATIDDRTITLGEFAERIAEEPPFVQARYATLDKRREFLERMVQFELMVQEALKQKLDETPRVRAAYKRALALELMEQQQARHSEMSDADLKAYYAKHKKEFATVEQRRAALLVVGNMAHATALRDQLRSAIADTPLKARQIFGDWVAKRSIDKATRIVKGDLGFFDAAGTPEGRRIPPPTEAVTAVFGLERIGDISMPIALGKDRFGLVQLSDRRPEQQRSFDQARVAIRSALMKKRLVKAREGFLASLRAKATIKVNEAALSKLKVPKTKGAAAKQKPDQKMLLPNDTSALRRHLKKRVGVPKAPAPVGARPGPAPRTKTNNPVKLPTEEVQDRVERHKNKVKGESSKQSGGEP